MVLNGSIWGFLAPNDGVREAGTRSPCSGRSIRGPFIVPFNFWLETVAFRVWEGALAVALASIEFYMCVRWDRSDISWNKLAAISIILSMFCFVAPAMAIAGVAVAAILATRNLIPRHLLAFAHYFASLL